jgi:thioesterase domain-containing protein
MAAQYVGAIRGAQPAGPYRLGGHSLGGRVAQEMARQLEIAGEEVEFLAAIDVPGGADDDSGWARRLDDAETLAHIVSQIELFHGRPLDLSASDLRAVAPEERASLVVTRMKERRLLPLGATTVEVSGLLEVYKANIRAIIDFTPQACRADIHVFATRSLREEHPQDLTLGWGTLTQGTVHVVPVPGEHMTLLAGSQGVELGRLILEACGVAIGHAHSANNGS